LRPKGVLQGCWRRLRRDRRLRYVHPGAALKDSLRSLQKRGALGATRRTLRAMQRDRIVHVLFDISVIGKGIDGVLEVGGGAVLLFISPMRIHNVARILTQHELSEDPHDLVATYLLNSTQHLSEGAQVFAAMYLLWHGIVKVALVTALLLKHRWAYPAAIFAFLLFLAYQLYRYTHTHSVELLVLSVVDLLVIVLTWLEYKRLRMSHAFT
jgi:uncharacterized membrane protein